jgi:hypothetical protein
MPNFDNDPVVSSDANRGKPSRGDDDTFRSWRSWRQLGNAGQPTESPINAWID